MSLVLPNRSNTDAAKKIIEKLEEALMGEPAAHIRRSLAYRQFVEFACSVESSGAPCFNAHRSALKVLLKLAALGPESSAARMNADSLALLEKHADLIEAHRLLVEAATLLPDHDSLHFVQGSGIYPRPPQTENDTNESYKSRELMANMMLLKEAVAAEQNLASKRGPSSTAAYAARSIWEASALSREVLTASRLFTAACEHIAGLLATMEIETTGAAVRQALDGHP